MLIDVSNRGLSGMDRSGYQMNDDLHDERWSTSLLMAAIAISHTNSQRKLTRNDTQIVDTQRKYTTK